MNGIYTVRHVPELYMNSDYEVTFYDSVEELLLMHFLVLMQENQIRIDLSTANLAKLLDVRDACWTLFEDDSILLAGIYLFQHLPSSILDELHSNYDVLIKEHTRFLTEAQYNDVLPDIAPAIKHVSVAYPGTQKVNSYCTVKVPVAYLYRTDCDVAGHLKQWLDDSVMDTIIYTLSKREYHSSDDLRDAISALADVYKFDDDLLFLEVQAILAKKLPNITWDTNLTFSGVVSTIFQQLIKEVYHDSTDTGSKLL